MQLLLELFSEEIPARMQGQAGRDLERMARERLTAASLTFESLRTFAGPRRLTLVVDGLPPAQADRTEEIKGPRAAAPPQALEGFLRKTGLTRDALTERDGVLFAHLARPGRPTPEIVAEMVDAVVRGFPWPKSMTWASGTLRWVRPLRRILCVFNRAVVPFEIEGIASGDLTEGHRFMSPESRGGGAGAPFAVRGFEDYAAGLAARFVALDAAERRARIEAGACAVCAAEGLELVPDEGLLDETAGLAEWPVPILGRMDPAFLDLPPEVIRTSMRTHQKYFSVRDPATGKLAPRFVVVANIEASDGGAALAAGNARVLSARLNDARFFWDEDRKRGAFDRWAERLRGVTFHAKLGTMAERVERIAALARENAPLIKDKDGVGVDPDLAERAARLCKLDLASAMVGEFPELQGVMGGYYARLAPPPSHGVPPRAPPSPVEREGSDGAVSSPSTGEEEARSAQPSGKEGVQVVLTPAQSDAVADAVRDHYKPVGPSDSVPTAPVTVAVALADKLDTLVGFFAIDERPTGSKDPYALRRAALGVIRLILESGVRLGLREIQSRALRPLLSIRLIAPVPGWDEVGYELLAGSAVIESGTEDSLSEAEAKALTALEEEISYEVDQLTFVFFADRLKVLLRDEGKRHDLVDAVFALGDDDLVRIVARVEALGAFLATEDGAALLAGYKRAANILRIEEKKDGVSYEPLDLASAGVSGKGGGPEEVALVKALVVAEAEIEPALAAEDFAGAMGALARLRGPVDAFFDRVLVNDPDPAVRTARLRLLAAIRAAANRVADFSRVSG